MQSFVSLFVGLVTQIVSIYTISINDITGHAINFSSFQKKKILIVNTATNSRGVAQYGKLEQLYQKYKDSLIIIAIPSNDFGGEPGDNASINNFVRSKYGIHYLLAEKATVSGTRKSYLYNWLSDKKLNGMADTKVYNNFYKYLISSDGKLIGIFSNEVDPLDQVLQDAIVR